MLTNNHIMKQSFIFLVGLTIIISCTGVFTSCKKTTSANAIITVVDPSGKNVAGAKVVLRNDSVQSPTTGAQANIYQEATTDLSGKAEFSFKWEAVLFVTATKGALSKKDYVRLEQSKTVEKTVILE
jgi:hypothetical protein